MVFAHKRHHRHRSKTLTHLQGEWLEPRQLLAGDTTVMFNDHVAGAGTHPNTTAYVATGTASGFLKDIDTGASTSIRLTTAASGATYDLITFGPLAGTDAAEIFNGYVEMGVGPLANIKLAGTATYTHTFTGLNPSATYEFIGTAIHGVSTSTAEWTRVTLGGAESYTVDHSAGVGVVTSGLPANEVALWTGYNRTEDTGHVVRWSNIRAGSDGTIVVTSRQYKGPTPGVGTGDSSSGTYGYGLEAIRLTEFTPSLRAIASTIETDSLLASPPTSITVDFNSSIVGGSIDASDLRIDGVPANSVSIVDSDTVTWSWTTAASPGPHSIEIPAGVLSSADAGITNQPFTINFHVLGLPSVANIAPTNLTPISTELGAALVDDGGENASVRIYWGTTDGGTTAANWQHVSSVGSFGTGSSGTTLLQGLSGQTTYYYRASAENAAGTAWAATTASFTTPSVNLPALLLTDPGPISDVTARAFGAVSDTGGEPPVITIVYGDNNAGIESPQAWDHQVTLGTRDGQFSYLLTGLTPDTDYYYTFFATNSAGTSHAQLVQSIHTLQAIPRSVVINEIHVDPNIKTEPVEYIELYNDSTQSLDLTGWRLADAVEFTFSAGTTIAPGGYLVISENPAAVQAKYGVTSLGPFTGSLSNEGDNIVLLDQIGVTQDRVEYGQGFPWPTVGEDPGYSMELIHPSLDNNLGGSWRSSNGNADTDTVYFRENSAWQYFKGFTEPSTTAGAWRQRNFDDSAWFTGSGAIGFGDGHVVTDLSDMRGGYTSVYFRKTFDVTSAASVGQLLLELQYDDGINVWINGVSVASRNVPGIELPYNAVANGSGENFDFQAVTIGNAASILVNGQNVMAVQLLNRSISDSSDAWFDARLKQSSGGTAGVTPGARNSVYSLNAAPQTRQVTHDPKQPESGEDVLITAKVTDPDGVGSVTLDYQIVAPGDYIELDDPRYETNWTTVTLRDDGLFGDEVADDDIYSVVMPGSMQQNRHLVRYRLNVTDTVGASIQLPYADDPTPNFAYFVYDGVPDWTGSARPGTAPNVTYPSELLKSINTYFFLTQSQSHTDAQYLPGTTRTSGYTGSEYLWQGTMVYDGEVYDHIRYRARGGVWRYSMGKNMWKFDFNRGHSFEARDNYGDKYDTPWDKVNFSAIIQQGDYLHRGEQGLFESVGFKMFDLAGVAAPHTQFVQFRLITGDNENGSSQYTGDFQGMYLAIEQLDGSFLDEHDLPDSNFYKMEGGTGELNNQGPTQPSNRSDLNTFLNTYNSTTPTEQWWRDNLDFDNYFSYRAIVEGIHHYDIGDGKNYFYLHNAETNKWQVHPWDLDLTWANNMYGSGNEPFKSRVADRAEFRAEYRNRMREIRDLLYNADQANQLIDEMARFIYTPGEPSLVDADRAMWDYNPILVSSTINTSKAGHGRYYQQATTRNFPGMIQLMKSYIVSRGNYIDSTILDDDASIPSRPQLSYTGSANFPLNELEFQSSALTGGAGTFAAMKWRIAEVTDADSPNYDPDDPVKYEINSTWESDEITTFNSRIRIPATDLEEGATYRVRVRLKNSQGYWSHWSEPIEFIASAPTGTDEQNYLRISEAMYNPAEPSTSEIGAGFVDNEDFEFIELVNTSSTTTLDLTGVSFTSGVSIAFPAGTSMAPGHRTLVVRNTAAFAARYGSALPVVGQYSGSLSNSGETLRVEGATAGVITEFSYSDGAAWPQAADGIGTSLELVDESVDPKAISKASSWQSSTTIGGTPGHINSSKLGVFVTEVLSHTDAPAVDAIELHNTSTSPIDISGWYISDSAATLAKFQIPPGTVLAPGGYLVFDEHNFNPNPLNPAPNDFSLDAAGGDDVWLAMINGTGAITHIVDDVHFGAAANGQSLARFELQDSRLLPTLRPSLGWGGDLPYAGEIVVTEINFNPSEPSVSAVTILPTITSSDLEFLELHNTSASSITLNDWRVRGDVDFDFSSGTFLLPGTTALLVPFDPASPTNGAKLQAFRAHYGIGASVRVLGGYVGQLSNGGGQVRVERPDTPPADDPQFIPRLTEDTASFDDFAAWPTSADGQGDTLQRVNRTVSGVASSSWSAALPTPGTVNFSLAPDFSGNGTLGSEDIDWLFAAIGGQHRSLAFDVNGDTLIDELDVDAMLADWLHTRRGDADLDGSVDAEDFGMWNTNRFQHGTGWAAGDFNGDGRTDASDFNQWNKNRFAVTPAAVKAQPAKGTPRAAAAAQPMTPLRHLLRHDMRARR